MRRDYLLILAVFFIFFLGACRDDEELSDLTIGSADEEEVQTVVDDSGVANIASHESADDYVWDSNDVIPIDLNGGSALTGGAGVSVSGNKLIITQSGNYSISGTWSDGQLYVNSEDDSTVRLILNNVDLTCSNNAALYINCAAKVILVLPEGTVNTIRDGASYSAEEESANAAVFSKTDMTIWGDGKLTVKGNYNDGISSKDGLVIAGGEIDVDAVDDGIRGKDYIVMNDGEVTVTCGGDGLKSDNAVDEGRGYISIVSGTLNVTSDGDAVSAVKDVIVKGGTLNLSSGGGSSAVLNSATSAKAIKSGVIGLFYGGTVTIDAADDGIHSDGDIQILGGTFNLASGDDGIHAENEMTLENTSISISKSVEGIESGFITVNSGTIEVYASDDGFNATQGTEVMTNDGSQLIVNGGSITVTVSGSDVDAMDSNGDITVNGGILNLYVPTTGPSEALDANGTITIGSDAEVYENGEVYTGSSSSGRRGGF